jgi:nucleotide-binding universal stress UspA family protein
MGTHGRSTLHATLVGSVALRVLQQIERPLLLIPDREH